MSRLAVVLFILAALPAAAPVGLRDLFPPGENLRPRLALRSFDTYTADTLWERINGEAEIHRSYGLVRAAYALYEVRGDAEQSLQIALFEMPDSLSAFGLYSSYRPRDGSTAGAGNAGTISDFQAFLWHGRYFAALESFGPAAFTAPALEAGLGKISAALGAEPLPPPHLAALLARVDEESVVYRPDHLLGRAALPPGLEGRTPSGHILFAATAAAASTTVTAYREVLEHPSVSVVGDRTILRGRDPVRGPVLLFFEGTAMAGVLHKDGEPPPESMVDGLLRALTVLP